MLLLKARDLILEGFVLHVRDHDFSGDIGGNTGLVGGWRIVTK